MRRSAAADAVPVALLAYRVRDWASVVAWRAARREYMASHPPRSLDELNRWYAPGALAPRPDPREVPGA